MADREVIGLGIIMSPCSFCCWFVCCVSGGVVAALLRGPDGLELGGTGWQMRGWTLTFPLSV